MSSRFTRSQLFVSLGTLVVVVAIFLPWFGFTVGASTVTVDGWNSWGLLVIVGVIIVVASVGSNLIGHAPSYPTRAPAVFPLIGAVCMVAGSILFLVNYRTSFASSILPVSYGLRYGSFLALLGSLIVLGGAVGYRRRSASPKGPS